MSGSPTQLSPWIYDAAASSWVQTPAPTTPGQTPGSLRVATWNVWFGELAFEQRTEALLAHLQRCDADVIALQEMTRRRLKALLRCPWVRERYALSDATGQTLGEYGVLLLSRLPVESFGLLPLPSRMGRSLLWATLGPGPRPLVVATAHLESLPPFAEKRREQLGIVTPALRSLPHDSLLVGDLNLDPGEEVDDLTEEFCDVWPALHPGQPGLTRDPARNLMRARKNPDSTPARIDRILLRSPRGGLRPRTIELLGTDPIDGSGSELFASDHFGLLATFEVQPQGINRE